MKYRIRTAIIFFFTGWYLSAIYYGHFPPSAQAQEIIQAAIPPQPQPLDVRCTFEFPEIPLGTLEG